MKQLRSIDQVCLLRYMTAVDYSVIDYSAALVHAGRGRVDPLQSCPSSPAESVFYENEMRPSQKQQDKVTSQRRR